MKNKFWSEMATISLVLRPIPSFSMLHTEKQVDLVCKVTYQHAHVHYG